MLADESCCVGKAKTAHLLRSQRLVKDLSADRLTQLTGASADLQHERKVGFSLLKQQVTRCNTKLPSCRAVLDMSLCVTEVCSISSFNPETSSHLFANCVL